MANELHPIGAELVLVKKEASYGSDPTPAAGDYIYFDTFTATPKQDALPRVGRTGAGPGLKAARGGSRVPFSYETELVLPTVTTAAFSDADLPTIDALMHAGGWVRRDDTAGGVIYVLADYHSQSSTFYHYSGNEAVDNANLVKMIGAVAPITWEWSAGERIKVSGEGMALGYATSGASTDVFAATGAARPSITADAGNPAVATNMVVKIIDLSDDSLYGGGTLASPGNNLLVTRAAFNPGQTTNEQLGLSGVGATARIRAYRDNVATLELTLEVTDQDEFDPLTLEADAQALEISLKAVEGNNEGLFLIYGVIVDHEFSEANGIKYYDLTIEAIYPENSGGSPAAGLKPDQPFTAGTNQGLLLSPNTLANFGVAVWQFRTTA